MQKTAYDVRIIDWSSDVCSSALRIVGGDHALVRGDIGKLLGRGMRKGRAVRKFLGDGKRGLLERLVGDDEVDEPPALERRGIVAACEPRHILRARHARALDLALDQIGGASCRDRVCRYVSTAVAGLSIKQKQT